MSAIDRRSVLKSLGLGAAALLGGQLPRAAFAEGAPAAASAPAAPTGPFTLPALPYGFDALEPHIDAQTMQIHHDKHHKAYIDNLNKAVGAYPDLGKQSIEAILRGFDKVPEPIKLAVRNHGGGHYNHSMFWQIMGPGQGGPATGDVARGIDAVFGSFTKFHDFFAEAAKSRFGSGWAWLVLGKDGKLSVASTPNQDCPLMEGAYPVLGLDVWEHAYYLKYQNRRPDYIAAWFNTVNWTAVNERLATGRKLMKL